MRMYASLVLWNSWLLDLLDAYFLSKKLGPEPSEQDFDVQVFQAALSKSKKPIKSHLLDQTLVAGLGNIYVDEVLWRAQVHPARLSQTLTAEEATAIHDQTIAVLGQAVEKGGSTIRTYTNAFGEDGTMQDFHQSMTRLVKNVYAVVPSLRKSN